MNFADILREAGIETRQEGQHTRPGWIQFNCPFCDGPLYMGFNVAGRYCNCRRCGPVSAVKTLTTILKKPYTEVKELLDHLDPGSVRIEKPSGVLQIPRGVERMRSAHRRDLRYRGYSPGVLERLWDLRGIAVASRLAWRIFIPILSNGRMVSWTTRAIVDDVDARYISASLHEEEVPHKTLLYGEDYCRHAIIIVEGPFDVWRIGPGAVATCGVGFSKAQVNRMSRYPIRVVCFDNEPKAQRRANELCDLLTPFDGETYNVQLSGKDAGESPDDEIQELRRRFL